MTTDPAVERCENRLILMIDRIAGAQHRLTKCLARGYVASELRGAIADLHNAANTIADIQKEWP